MRSQRGVILVSITGALLALISGDALAKPAHARIVLAGASVTWAADRAPGKMVYRFGALTVSVSGVPDTGSPDGIRPRMVVEMPGSRPVEVTGDVGPVWREQQLSFGNFAPGLPGVLFENFTGGAHCCNIMTAVFADKGRLRLAKLGSWDGDYLKGFPADIDHDGVADIQQRDNAFLYAFSSYAGSYAPPVVLNITAAGVSNVSQHATFRLLFAKDAAFARRACMGGSEPGGACAGYVASSARSGGFATAWAEMLTRYNGKDRSDFPTRCRVEPAAGATCPARAIMPYPEALRAFLIRNGYLTR
jgi:hypothetical protein